MVLSGFASSHFGWLIVSFCKVSCWHCQPPTRMSCFIVSGNLQKFTMSQMWYREEHLTENLDLYYFKLTVQDASFVYFETTTTGSFKWTFLQLCGVSIIESSLLRQVHAGVIGFHLWSASGASKFTWLALIFMRIMTSSRQSDMSSSHHAVVVVRIMPGERMKVFSSHIVFTLAVFGSQIGTLHNNGIWSIWVNVVA